MNNAHSVQPQQLVFMLEGESDKKFLDGLLPRILPDMKTLCIPHGGKHRLKKSISSKLKGWLNPNAYFVILHDQDSACCRSLKEELLKLCEETV